MSTCRRKSDIARGVLGTSSRRCAHSEQLRRLKVQQEHMQHKSMVQEDHFRKSQKPLQRPWHQRKQPRQPARPVGVAKIGLGHGRAEAERRPFSIRLL